MQKRHAHRDGRDDQGDGNGSHPFVVPDRFVPLELIAVEQGPDAALGAALSDGEKHLSKRT